MESREPNAPHDRGARASRSSGGPDRDGNRQAAQHPGFDNYPPPQGSARRPPLPPLPPLNPPRQEPQDPQASPDQDAEPRPSGVRTPRKLTVTRVAAMRSRELTGRGIATFQRAAKADGADKSGLTALTYATMANFATDAAVAVALANTLFFSAATAESKMNVALYLLITIAPFALIAPLIGPMLDRLQRGRRVALAASFAARGVLAVLLIFNFDTWALYPIALVMLVLSKSFAVLKSAVTPRVLPPEIDLVRTNSRLTVFGLLGGTIGAGAIAAGVAWAAGSIGALWFTAVLAAGGAYLSLRIPSWVEVTEGEVPTTLSYHGVDAATEVIGRDRAAAVKPSKRRQPLGRTVVTGLWGNSTIRVLTGFITLYIAFVAKSRTEHDPLQQALMLGLVGVAAALGNFAGNATGARLQLGRPTLIVLRCAIAVTVVSIGAAFADSLWMAALATLVGACASALAKVSLDASIQQDLPEESVASAFGRSETVLQLSWVIGGAFGVMLPTEFWIGFTVISLVLVLGLAQTVMSYRGRSLLPGLGGNRPVHADQEVPGGNLRIHQTTGKFAP
ncbi:MFS transporter [Aldersonia sp. NBC_00410]|uniref:MFS transporter n=1 Tax=Aldersonia sp. NBC_00410 TaxID=2975954 RepID=UPI002252137C|nr:MFS transporter [Aldersonia sp. NBC_00410]MCX5045708.1 MFS transporter [Aldersonia sp. NBC_00410]